MKLQQIIRYPIKGLSAELVDTAELEPGKSIPFDRSYAIAHGRTAFDAKDPAFLSKTHFLMLMSNPKLASVRARFDANSRSVSVSLPDGHRFSGDLESPVDRSKFENLLGSFIGKESRGGPPRVVSANAHQFFDARENFLSLINLESVSALARAVGKNLDPIRFRGNLHVSGMPAWQEADLVGMELQCGEVTFVVAEQISRCTATSVNPDTAEVDVNVPQMLRRHFATNHMGLYLTVIAGGILRRDDTVVVSRRARDGGPAWSSGLPD